MTGYRSTTGLMGMMLVGSQRQTPKDQYLPPIVASKTLNSLKSSGEGIMIAKAGMSTMHEQVSHCADESLRKMLHMTSYNYMKIGTKY